MTSHPCDKGLTRACFASYHKWAKQALAYKLTRLLLPKELSRRLPGVLRNALIGPGAILPPGLVLPPGTIVPPGFTWPDHWTPWQYFDFTTLEDPRTLFPPGWVPGDPLPPGVTLPPGYALPPDWTPADPPPPAFIPGYSPFPTPPESGAIPPLFIPPFEPGPISTAPPGPSVGEHQAIFLCTGSEFWARAASPWSTQHDATSGTDGGVNTVSPNRFARTSYNGAFYIIERSIFRFDVSALPAAAQMVSGFLTFKPSSGTTPTVCVQETSGIAWNAAADYSKGVGAAIDPKSWTGATLTFTLNASALAACKAAAGGVVYFMGKEHPHDFLNVAPTVSQNFEAQAYNDKDATPSNRPTLTLTYKA